MASTFTNPTVMTTAAGDEAIAVARLCGAVTTTDALTITDVLMTADALTITDTWTTADTRTAARHTHPLTTRRRRVGQCRRSRQVRVDIQAVEAEATGTGTRTAADGDAVVRGEDVKAARRRPLIRYPMADSYRGCRTRL